MLVLPGLAWRPETSAKRNKEDTISATDGTSPLAPMTYRKSITFAPNENDTHDRNAGGSKNIKFSLHSEHSTIYCLHHIKIKLLLSRWNFTYSQHLTYNDRYLISHISLIFVRKKGKKDLKYYVNLTEITLNRRYFHQPMEEPVSRYL
mgnify:CR=1 FL=1